MAIYVSYLTPAKVARANDNADKYRHSRKTVWTRLSINPMTLLTAWGAKGESRRPLADFCALYSINERKTILRTSLGGFVRKARC